MTRLTRRAACPRLPFQGTPQVSSTPSPPPTSSLSHQSPSLSAIRLAALTQLIGNLFYFGAWPPPPLPPEKAIKLVFTRVGGCNLSFAHLILSSCLAPSLLCLGWEICIISTTQERAEAGVVSGQQTVSTSLGTHELRVFPSWQALAGPCLPAPVGGPVPHPARPIPGGQAEASSGWSVCCSCLSLPTVCGGSPGP